LVDLRENFYFKLSSKLSKKLNLYGFTETSLLIVYFHKIFKKTFAANFMIEESGA
jgi:hypothetical protein